MNNKDINDNNFLNQKNLASPIDFSENKKGEKIFPLIYLFYAFLQLLFLFLLASQKYIYTTIFIFLLFFILVIQIIFIMTLCLPFIKIKSWTWWGIIVINPFSQIFGITLAYLMIQFVHNGLQPYFLPEEIMREENVFPIGFFYLAGIILLINALFLYLFWKKQRLFFDKKHLLINKQKFVFIQICVLVLAILLGLLVYLIIETPVF